MKLRVPVTLSVAFVGAAIAATAVVTACGGDDKTADAPHECELFCVYVGPPTDAGTPDNDAGTDCGKCADEYPNGTCPADCEAFG